MDKNMLKERAETYLKEETNKNFLEEIEDLLAAENWAEISERFYRDLEFGTGGIRGILGGGSNRMNTLVIANATQGLSNYLMKAGKAGKKAAVIAYDSRRFSREFAQMASEVLCGNGIRVYLFSSLRPTPELSFAVRRLGADAGIVITASHNPKNYNGYKVYWVDGGQVVPPHDKGIIAEVTKVGGRIKRMDTSEALRAGLLTYIDKELDEPYVDTVVAHALRPDVLNRQKDGFAAVYTPLHGAGRKPVEEVFSRLGIRLLTVPEQQEPDGDFPTVTFPNPEEASALDMAVSLAKKENADLVLGTDPDSDRLGIAVPSGEGDAWVLLNGNQTGSLMAEYIFSTLKEQNRMPPRAVLIKTIVTTNLQRKIGEYYGAKVIDVLTGFKYIAEQILKFEKTGDIYVFGGEESYGYLIGTEVRDKDAVSAAAMVAEMALYCRDRDIGVLEYLEEIYRKYGYFQEILVSKTFPGQEGMAAMNRFMTDLRNSFPKVMAGLDVISVADYMKRSLRNLSTGKTVAIDLPESDVLQFTLADDTLISVRPSGTEPKLKFYASVCVSVSGPLEEARAVASEKLDGLREYINGLVESMSTP